MANNRKSRKRRPKPAAERPPQPPEGDLPERYARSRARDEEARAALKPLRAGERPVAVTVGAVAAALLALANVIAIGFGYNSGEDTLATDLAGTIIVSAVLVLVAYGMWRARYWAVLGMQTLLALTIIFAALALIRAVDWWAATLVLIILVSSSTLFWFLIKAMARIQMPERPGSQRTG